MIIEVTREDLLLLCREIAKVNSPIKGKPFFEAFQRRDFINGFHYRLSESFALEATDEQLLEFCTYHSQTIKSIK
jgi:hypothetical protein